MKGVEVYCTGEDEASVWNSGGCVEWCKAGGRAEPLWTTNGDTVGDEDGNG